MSESVVTPQVTAQTDATNSHDLLTAKECATILRCSEDTAIRYLSDLPGVIVFGSPREDVRKHKRRYRIIRVPRVVLHKFIKEHRVQ